MFFVVALTIINITAAYFLSKSDNFFRSSENMLTGEYIAFFSSKVNHIKKRYDLEKKNKYFLELNLFYFVIFLFLILNLALSYIDLTYLKFDSENLIESSFKVLFIEFIIIIATALIFNKFKDSYRNSEKIKAGDYYHAYLSENELIFPFMTLEDSVASELARTEFIYLCLPVSQIEEFIVEKSIRVSSVRGSTYTPPYYKIKMQNKQSYIYVMRMYFNQLEKQFIADLQNILPIKIILNDKLNG